MQAKVLVKLVINTFLKSSQLLLKYQLGKTLNDSTLLLVNLSYSLVTYLLIMCHHRQSKIFRKNYRIYELHSVRKGGHIIYSLYITTCTYNVLCF